MSVLNVAKVVASLPGTLVADTIYAVRTGVGFDLYVSDVTGSVAHRINSRLPVGMLSYWPVTTPPADWLVCDGSAITIASYPALAALLYCGAGNNTSASWGFKATSAVSPASNRSTSGAYLVLPDHRNRYVRGWQSGGSFGMWTYYEDMLKSHSHTIPARARTSALTANAAEVEKADTTNFISNATTSSDGGTETRPKTVMALPIIYAGP